MLSTHIQAGDADLAAALYHAVLDASLWPATLGRLCARFAAAAAALIAVPGGRIQHVQTLAVGCAPPAAGRHAGDAARTDWHLLLASPDANEGGGGLLMSAQLDVEEESRAALMLRRQPHAPPFDSAARLALADIAQQAGAALEIRRQLERPGFADAVRAAALDHMPNGVIAATGDGTAIYLNRCAQTWLRALGSQVGVGLRLLIGDPDTTPRLLNLLSGAASGGPGGSLRLAAPAGQAPLALSVSRLPFNMEGRLPSLRQRNGDNLALVTLRRLAPASGVKPQRMMDLFNLTQAEAAVLHLLVSGQGADAIAATRGVAAPTVRTQLRSIMAKTGTHNLRGLTALMLSLGPD